MKEITKVVLPVAGMGTRMLPITKVVPKELLGIIERPTIEYIIDEVKASGIETIVFVISQGKGKIIDYFDIDQNLRSFLKERGKLELLKIVEEVESKVEHLIGLWQKAPEGLGQAILIAEKVIENEPFGVLLGDDLVDADPPCLKQMMDVYKELKGNIIAIEEVSWERVSKYGIIDGKKVSDRLIKIEKVIEKPKKEEAPTNLAIIGRYIFEPYIFDYLKRIKKGPSGEYQLTDAIELMINDGKPVYAFLFDGKRFDTGSKEGYFETILHYALKKPEFKKVFLDFIKKELSEETKNLI